MAPRSSPTGSRRRRQTPSTQVTSCSRNRRWRQTATITNARSTVGPLTVPNTHAHRNVCASITIASRRKSFNMGVVDQLEYRSQRSPIRTINAVRQAPPFVGSHPTGFDPPNPQQKRPLGFPPCRPAQSAGHETQSSPFPASHTPLPHTAPPWTQSAGQLAHVSETSHTPFVQPERSILHAAVHDGVPAHPPHVAPPR